MRSALARPDGDAASRSPGDDAVHADLGQALDGGLAPVTLRNGLDHGDRGVRAGHLAPGAHGQLKTVAATGRDYALGHQAGAVADVGALAGAQPADGGRVPPLGPGQDDDLAVQVRAAHVEDRRLRHRRPRVSGR